MYGRKIEPDTDSCGKRRHHDSLNEGADTASKRLAQNQGRSRCGRGQKFMYYPQVAFRNDGDAIEDGDKKNTLGQDTWREELYITHIPGRNGVRSSEDLTKDQKPKGRLHRARDQIDGVVAKLA